MKVLITGSAGQVGGELQRVLAPMVQAGRVELVAVDREAFDIGDPAETAAFVQSVQPRIIINAAAYTAVDKAESEPDTAHAVNVAGPRTLAAEAKKLGAQLVHYSTDYVFDGTKASPYVEDDAPAPLGAYGRGKLDGELAVLISGCRHLVLRTSWVYGPRGGNFLLTMLRLAASRPELRVVDDQFGAPTTSRMIAEATARLLFSDVRGDATAPGGLYHMTAAGSTTWCRFARAILAGAGIATPVIAIATREYPTPAARPANSVLDNSRFEKRFGFRLPAWEDGLRQCLAALAAERTP